MYKSKYLNDLLEQVKAKNGEQKEFISAVEEFFDSMDYLVDKDPRIEANAIHLPWTFEEVDARLQQIMKDIFKKCHETAVKYGQPNNVALGANIAGFLKVLEAMLAQGVC